MTEDLYVEEGTGLVRKVKLFRNLVISDEPYKPNGKCIFVNPKTDFLEEGELIHNPWERVAHESHYRKKSDFTSNGNQVIFHPEKKEFAEVKKGYFPESYNKVKDLQIAS